MLKLLTNKYLLLLLRLVLALVFIYAGVEKISDPERFSQSISNYKLLPVMFVNFFAIVLPWIEVVAGLLLLFGIEVKENSFILSILLLVFISAIGISLARGLNIECGCFGTSSGAMIGFNKLGENLIYLLIAFLLVKFDSDFFSISSLKKNGLPRDP